MQVLCIRTVTAMHHLEEQQMEEREQFRALTSACAVRMSPMLSWFGCGSSGPVRAGELEALSPNSRWRRVDELREQYVVMQHAARLADELADLELRENTSRTATSSQVSATAA